MNKMRETINIQKHKVNGKYTMKYDKLQMINDKIDYR